MIYFLSKKASYTIMKIAIPIKIYTGNTSRKDIIIDLVRVVANPIRKNNAKDRPTSVVILFIVLLTFLFQPPSNSKKSMIIILVTD